MADKTYGIHKKPRTLDEINQDYNLHAAQLGHKHRVVYQLQNEIDEHLQRLLRINDEAAKLKQAPTESKQEVKVDELPTTALAGEP